MQSGEIDQKYLDNIIYIVDDDSEILKSLTTFFQMKGFTVHGRKRGRYPFINN